MRVLAWKRLTPGFTEGKPDRTVHRTSQVWNTYGQKSSRQGQPKDIPSRGQLLFLFLSNRTGGSQGGHVSNLGMDVQTSCFSVIQTLEGNSGTWGRVHGNHVMMEKLWMLIGVWVTQVFAWLKFNELYNTVSAFHHI